VKLGLTADSNAAQATNSETVKPFQAFSVEERMQGLHLVADKVHSSIDEKDKGEFKDVKAGT